MNPDTATSRAPLHDEPPAPPPPYAGPSYPQDPYPSAPPPLAPPADRRKRRQHWAGAILMVLGLLWWIEARYLLPLILVAAGAWLMFGRGRRG